METEIWDMDGTLTTSNCFYAYLQRRLLTSPLRLARSLPVLWRMKRASSHDAKAAQGHRLVAIALNGMTLEEYHAEARDFGASLVKRDKWMRAEAVQQIKTNHADGAHIVIATACEEALARSVLAHAGVTYDMLSATRFTSSSGGIIAADPRDGERKTLALDALGVPLRESLLYTDDISDLPTAKRCRGVVLIAPNRDTLRAYRDAGVEASPAPWLHA